VYGDPTKITPDLIDLYVDMTLREGNRRALGLRMAQRAGGEGASPVSRCPLILWGRTDRLIPPTNGQRLQRHWGSQAWEGGV
jgi:hypothetical protein